jgi:hypothetical protein
MHGHNTHRRYVRGCCVDLLEKLGDSGVVEKRRDIKASKGHQATSLGI